ncbi:MAG: glycosyltransferase family 4 protein [Candidatus Diapherotrites archaeon]|nr:glycosyltransferase family 4 protein [Candidatus Diapherotrites archaeon]
MTKTIGIISDAPVLTTGFGRTSAYIGKAIEDLGSTVIYFGIGLTRCVHSNVFPVPRYVQLPDAMEEFLDTYSPDVLIFNSDIASAILRHRVAKGLGWHGFALFHIVVDGFPVNAQLLDYLRNNGQTIVVPTRYTQRYLRNEGIAALYAPHGIEHSRFIPLSEEERGFIRRHVFQVYDNEFVIGIFARNDWRKQIPLILEAVSLAKHYPKIKLYLHSQKRSSRGWDLEEVARYYGIQNRVIFANTKTEFGVPLDKFVRLLGSCDLVINVPCNGGFELVTLEAQSLGIPLITVNDKENITEASGGGALLLEPVAHTHWVDHGICYFVSPYDLADAIDNVVEKEELRYQLKQRGLINAKRYSWGTLKKVIQDAIKDALS